MLIGLPWIIRKTGMPEIVGGAWLGGTLDTTASVTAAAELVGPAAIKAGVIVKFTQNVLIGVAAFLIAGWWLMRKTGAENKERPSLKMIWERFPKVRAWFYRGVPIIFFSCSGTYRPPGKWHFLIVYAPFGLPWHLFLLASRQDLLIFSKCREAGLRWLLSGHNYLIFYGHYYGLTFCSAVFYFPLPISGKYFSTDNKTCKSINRT